jgi:hypothetical protein
MTQTTPINFNIILLGMFIGAGKKPCQTINQSPPTHFAVSSTSLSSFSEHPIIEDRPCRRPVFLPGELRGRQRFRLYE